MRPQSGARAQAQKFESGLQRPQTEHASPVENTLRPQSGARAQAQKFESGLQRVQTEHASPVGNSLRQQSGVKAQAQAQKFISDWQRTQTEYAKDCGKHLAPAIRRKGAEIQKRFAKGANRTQDRLWKTPCASNPAQGHRRGNSKAIDKGRKPKAPALWETLAPEIRRKGMKIRKRWAKGANRTRQPCGKPLRQQSGARAMARRFESNGQRTQTEHR